LGQKAFGLEALRSTGRGDTSSIFSSDTPSNRTLLRIMYQSHVREDSSPHARTFSDIFFNAGSQVNKVSIYFSVRQGKIIGIVLRFQDYAAV
jgi:hypothetical protein